MTLQANLEVPNSNIGKEQQPVLPQEVNYINLGNFWPATVQYAD
jgi:hypothetical protein